MLEVPALKPLLIRTALPADLQAVFLIEDDSFPSPYPPELFKKLLQEHGDSFFIAKISDQLVGYCLAARDGKFAHLISIAVLREHRRKGVANELLRHLVEYLARHRVDELWLEVNTANNEAIGLYERLGFARMMILENYYSDGAPALRMRLALNRVVLREERKRR